MLSLTDFLDNSILLGLSLKASECVFKRFIFFYTNLAHYIPSLRLIAGVNYIFFTIIHLLQYVCQAKFTIFSTFFAKFYFATILTNFLGTYISLITVLPAISAAILSSALAAAIASAAEISAAIFKRDLTLPLI